MGESRAHMELVLTVERYIRARLPSDAQSRVCVDTPDTGTTPAVCGGFHPDVYVRTSERLLLGEAKTERDFKRPHSISQLKAYFEECRQFGGSAEIVVAVPWLVVRSALNFFRRVSESTPTDNVVIAVLDERGGVFKA